MKTTFFLNKDKKCFINNDIQYFLNEDTQCFLNETHCLSIHNKTLLIQEKDYAKKLDLNKISNVRIIKTRSLLLNYSFLAILLVFYALLRNFLIDFLLKIVLNVAAFILIVATFRLRKYSYELLINTTDLTFRNYTVSNDKFYNVQTFISTLKKNIPHLSENLNN